MKKNLTVHVMIVLLLTGCASASSGLISSSPDRYDVTCNKSLGYCHEEAANVCPNGYTVLDGADHSSAVVMGNGNGMATAMPIYHGEIIVECK